MPQNVAIIEILVWLYIRQKSQVINEENVIKAATKYIGEDQYGFRKGRGTRDAISVNRCLEKGVWNRVKI
jgi:hypothetical protein